MFYRNELQFLCDTLQKNRIRASVVTPVNFAETVSALGENAFPMGRPLTSPRFPSDSEPYTVYKLADTNGLCFLYFLLPETGSPTLLFVGPYLPSSPSPERLQELEESCGVSPARKSYFREFYNSLPILNEGNPLFVMLTTFCERIWKRPAFSIVDVNQNHQGAVSPINEPLHDDNFDDVLVHIKAMENRYAFENELIRAVSLGQLHKESQLLSAFSDQAFEKRLPDALRNAKNYGVIMNTLLRKAAENGGVHPVYLNRVSSEFAAKIEHMSELSETSALMCEMFRTYCRLVRKHALQHFSLVVQKTILIIDSDLSASLSLKSLADHQSVSAGYLSTIFKKETGKTLSEYIREKRIRHASHLLATTHLQIQTVALHCGIMDVQYFSKTFKKLTGKTPKEYRESVKQPPKV